VPAKGLKRGKVVLVELSSPSSILVSESFPSA
jgi:hypothetical protein